ncbi:MAG: TIR domain-containing protein [Desulfobacterales bacterium]|nr:MAG: TIR domain-containing protein [Desulfobacterales bacterium]
MRYNAFISYSHSVDNKFAIALQNGIQRFATSWNPLRRLNPVRSLRIFRDETSLAANPALWPSIEEALDRSEWFILLASADAARSPWIEREADFWCRNKPVNRVLIVLTNGEIVWSPNSGDFDWEKTSALPRRFSGVFDVEPRWVDMRWAHSAALPPLSDPRFRYAIADLVSPLRNIPKDDLIGEDIRQHRILRRWRNIAVIMLSILLIGALAAAQVARKQRGIALLREREAIEQKNEAERQSRTALALQLAAQSNLSRLQWTDRIELSLLLAVESVKLRPAFEGIQALSAALALTPRRIAYFRHQPNLGVLFRVNKIAFSPDSRYLATASDDGTAALWEIGQERLSTEPPHRETKPGSSVTSDGSLRFPQTGFGADVKSVAFSPDGRLLAIGDADGSVRLWIAKTGQEHMHLKHDGAVLDLVFDSKGNYLATGSKDGTAHLWDLHNGREVGRFSYGSGDFVVDVDFSPDGRFLAANAKGWACIYDAERTFEDKCFPSEGVVSALSYSPDGKYLATAEGSVAQIWAVTSGERQVRVEHRDYVGAAKMHFFEWIDDLAFTPDGQYLATASRDGTARIWDVASGQEVVRLLHSAQVNAVAFSPDGRTVVTASAAGNIHGWETLTGREVFRVSLRPNVYILDVLAVSPDAKYVAAGNNVGEIGVWQQGAANEHTRLTHPDDVRKIAFSPDGKYIATADDDHIIRLWATHQWQEVARVKRFSPRKLLFSQDSRFIAVQSSAGGLELLSTEGALESIQILSNREAKDVILHPRYLFSDGGDTIKVWETEGGASVAELEIGGYFDDFTISGNAIFASTLHEKERTVRIWNVPEARLAGEIASQFVPHRIALSPKGEYLAVAVVRKRTEFSSLDDGIWHVEIWKVAEHRQVAQIPLDQQDVEHLFFHPDGRRLFIVGGPFQWPNIVRGFDIASGNEIVQLSDAVELRKIQLSPDGEHLAAISKGRDRVWDLRTGQIVAQGLSRQHIQDLSFTADGRYLATAGNDNSATLWLWRPEDLVSEACERITRNLTSTEWQDYLGGKPYQKTCPNLPSEEEANRNG